MKKHLLSTLLLGLAIAMPSISLSVTQTLTLGNITNETDKPLSFEVGKTKAIIGPGKTSNLNIDIPLKEASHVPTTLFLSKDVRLISPETTTYKLFFMSEMGGGEVAAQAGLHPEGRPTFEISKEDDFITHPISETDEVYFSLDIIFNGEESELDLTASIVPGS